MKKVRFIFQILFLVVFLVGGHSLFGQETTPLRLVWDNQGNSIKGDFIQIGNRRHGGGESRSTLKINVDTRKESCLKVKWAGLYWVSTLNQNNTPRTTPEIGKVQFKLPGRPYQEITEQRRTHALFAGFEYLYNCYADVTALLQGLGDGFNNAEYAVKGIFSDENTGGWGGWTLVVVYEDINQFTAKRLFLYEGCDVNFFNYGGRQTKRITITDFKTPPAPIPVEARMGLFVGAGNINSYDAIRINNVQQGNTSYPNRRTDFMDGSFTVNHNENNFLRDPRESNINARTSFVDLDIFDIQNVGNTTIPNNATSLNIDFEAEDAYITYVVPFSVQVIEPEIQIEKKAFKGSVDVTGGNVNLGDIVRYEISFKNTGTDDAKNLTFSDVLPENLDITNVLATLNVPTGVTHTLNTATRELKFTVPDNLVRKNSATHKITFEVQVPPDCNSLKDPCSNEIKNIIKAEFWGHINSPVDPFVAQSTTAFPSCGGIIEGFSTFISSLGTCTSKRSEVLCRPSITLTATDGFESYQWTKQGVSRVLGTGKTLTVTSTGTYKVTKIKAGCANMVEEIEILPHLQTNPINAFASEVLKCGNDGSDYPQIYLCGSGSSKQINLSIAGATYKWEKRNNCNVPGTYLVTNCPVYDQFGCTWATVGTEASFTARDAGDYRVTIEDSGCLYTFYFHVTKTELNPTRTLRDVICTKPGVITVNNVPAGYQYELRKNDKTSIVKAKQSSNTFSITTAEFDAHGVGGSYVVFIYGSSTQTNTRDCVFELPVSIRKRNPQLVITPTPMACENSKGSIRVRVQDAYPQYTYEIRQNSQTGAVVVPATITNDPDKTFPGLNQGMYYIKVTTSDGCVLSTVTQVTKIPDLNATATVKRQLMCGTAIIRVNVTGGTKDATYGYSYRLNGETTTYQDYGAGFYEFTVTNAGTYTVEVIDRNTCTANTLPVTVRQLTPPTYTVNPVLTDCGEKAKVTFSVTNNPENYTFRYSIDGVNFQSGNIFSNLTPGATITPTLSYLVGTESCTVTDTLTLPQAVTGSVYMAAGVASLIGCGNGANSDKAEVRVTNVLGGTPPYEYSYDDGNNWVANTIQWLPAGTHTVKVRDAIGCEWSQQVVINPAPVRPQFTPVVTYACDGKGIVTVGSNQSTFSYTYTIGGVTTSTNVIGNLAVGTHNLVINYADITAPTKNLLLIETFGRGDRVPGQGIYGMTTLYRNIDPRAQSLGWNQYFVAGTKDISPTAQANGWWNGDAQFPNDHTNKNDASSRYMAVDFGALIDAGAVFFEKDVQDVIPNQPIEFEMFGYNLVKSSYGGFCTKPVMIMEVVALDNAGNVVMEGGQPKILGKVQSKEIPQNTGKDDWYRFSSDGTWVDTAVTPSAKVNPGSYTRLKIRVRTKHNVTGCNDFAFDDISIYQYPKVCGATHTLTISVLGGKAFATTDGTKKVTNPSCSGGQGKFEIELKNTEASVWYSLNSGTYTEYTFPTGSSVFKLDNLNVGNYTITIRHGQNTANCQLTETFEIKNPAQLVLQSIVNQTLSCDTNSVRVTASATGGTGNLTYTLSRAGVAPISQSSPNFTIRNIGNYSLSVRDMSGCVTTQTFSVAQATPPTIAVDATSNYCLSTGNDASIKVNLTGGTAPFTYAINGSVKSANNTASSFTFTALGAGTHTITVTDSKGCRVSHSETIKPKLSDNITKNLEKDITCDVAPNNRAKINITINGGYAPYRYSVQRNGVNVTTAQNQTVTGNTFSYQDATAGNYTIIIRDSKGCVATVTETFTTPVAPTATHTKEDVKCKGEGTGKITVNATNGVAPYQYRIGTGTWQASNVFTSLPAGTYSVSVIDAKKCVTTINNIIITEPAEAIRAFAGVSELIGCGTGVNQDKAKVRVTNAQGGSGAYEYSFTDRATWVTSQEGWMSPGNRTVYIRDKNAPDCSVFPISVTIPNRPVEPTFTSTVSYDCDGTGVVSVTSSIASYTYEYSIDGGATQTSPVFKGLTPGTHIITVKYIDPNAPNPNVLFLEDFGTGAGTSVQTPYINSKFFFHPQITRNATLFNREGTSRFISGLNDGSYTVTDRLKPGFGFWSRNPIDHTGLAGGRMLFINIGNVLGTPKSVLYQRVLNDVIPHRPIKFSVATFNLLAGSILNQIDTTDPIITLELYDDPAKINQTDNSQALAVREIGVRHPNGNYYIPKSRNDNDWNTYEVELNPGSASTLYAVLRSNSLVVGGNDLVLDDIYLYQNPGMCAFTKTITVVVQSNKAFKTDTNNITVTDVACNGNNTGVISIPVQNFDATNGYRYKLNNDAWSGNVTNNTLVINNLPAGTHTIALQYHKGGNTYGCTQTVTRNITQPDALGLTATITVPAMCSNGNTATVRLTATGGAGGYKYRLGTGALQNSNVFTSVPTGNNIFSVTDRNGCTYTITTAFNVPQPKVVSFTAKPTACYSGNNDGQVAVTVTGGNNDYKFSINNASLQTPLGTQTLTYTFRNLPAGTHTVRVEDGFGCFSTTTVVIHPRLNVQVKNTSISCNNGKIEVIATGGAGTYKYAFVAAGSPEPTTFVTNSSLTVSVPATYDVYVKSGDCLYKEPNINVVQAPAIGFTAVGHNPTCEGGRGTIEMTGITGDKNYTIGYVKVASPNTPVREEMNFTRNSYRFIGVEAGTYLVYAKDRYGCTFTSTVVTITAKETLTGKVEVQPLPPGRCVEVGHSVPLQLEISSTLLASYAGFNIYYSADNGVTYNPTPLTATITALVEGAIPFVAGNTFTVYLKTVPVGGGDHTAPATCLIALPVYTVQYPLRELSIAVKLGATTCAGAGSGFEVEVTVTDGDDPYYFTMEDPNTSPAWIPATQASGNMGAIKDRHTFTGLIPGRTYNFYAKDKSNCIVQNKKDIYAGYTMPVGIATPTVRPICHGATTGGGINFAITNVTTTATGNFTAVVYEKTGAITGNVIHTFPATPMPVAGNTIELKTPATVQFEAGKTYYLILTDSNGCQFGSKDVIMYVGQQLSATPVRLRNITCDAKGVISIENPIGGGGSYSYHISSTSFNAVPTVADLTFTSTTIEIPKAWVNGTGTITVDIEMRSFDSCPETLASVDIYVAKDPVILSVKVDSCQEPLSITVTPATGETPAVAAPLADYLYSIDGGTNWEDNEGKFTGLTAGTYRVGIKDKATGCEVIQPAGAGATVLHPKLSVGVAQTKLLGCGVNAEMVIKVLAGSGDYQYEVSGGTTIARTALPATTHTVTGSVSGNYVITIYDQRVDCGTGKAKATFTITVQPAILPEFALSTQSVTCNAGSDGRIFINEVDKGTAPYTYTILPAIGTWNAAAKSFDNLPAGTYTITSRGNALNNCTTERSVKVGQPDPITITSLANFVKVTEFMCVTNSNDRNVAKVELVPSAITGGTAPYTFKMVYDNGTPAVATDDITVTGTTQMTITNHLGGNVVITITDASGCNHNSAVLPISALIQPYEQIAGLTVTVTSPIPCGGTEGIRLVAHSVPNPAPQLTTTKLEYAHKNSGIPSVLDWQTSDVFIGLPIGVHTFWVRHIDTGCMTSVVHEVKNPNTFVINQPTIVEPICKGGTSTVAFNVFDETFVGNYSYQVVSGTSVVIPATTVSGATKIATFTITTLTSGIYTLTVTQLSHPSCSKTYTFEVIEPSVALTASVTSEPITCALNDGVINVINPQGGWGGYEYRITPAATGIATAWTATPTFTGLVADTYNVEIKDARGCEVSVSSTVTLSNPATLTATMTIVTQQCTPDSGVVSVTATGGEGKNYTFQLIKDGVDYGTPKYIATGNSVTFSGLAKGVYSVRVSDTWGCVVTMVATTSSTLFDPITGVDVEVQKVLTCSTPQEARIKVLHRGGSNTITYTITDALGNILANQTGVFSVTTAGAYIVQLFDTITGCATTTYNGFTLEDTIPVSFTRTQTNVSCNGGSDGTITVDLPVSQTQTPYEVKVEKPSGAPEIRTGINAVGTSLTFNGLQSGLYTITVTSGRGCTGVQTLTITQPDVLIVSNTTTITTQFACNALNEPQRAVLTVVPQGGTAPYYFSIDNSDFTNTTGVFSITNTGATQTITVYIIDANGCRANNAIAPIVVKPLPRITDVKIRTTQRYSCIHSEMVDVTVLGGSGAGFLIEVTSNDPSVVTPTAQTVPSMASFILPEPAQYQFKITDLTTGCYEELIHTVNILRPMDVTVAEKSTVTCFGEANGEITLTTSNYNGVYRYEVLDANTLASLPTPITGTVTVLVASTPKSINIANVPAGQYVVRITENNMPFCVVTSTMVTIGRPSKALTYTLTVDSVLTCEDNNAILSIETAGGWGDYEYKLLVNGNPHSVYGNYTSTSTYIGLGEGDYQVVIKDRKGCVTTTATETITLPTPISFVTVPDTTSVIMLKCYGDETASITVNSVTGGSGNYHYTLLKYINNAFTELATQTQTVFTGLGEGRYVVKVTDDWACEMLSQEVLISEPTEMEVTGVVNVGLTCIAQAEIIVSATGGTPPYEFSESSSGGFTTNNVFLKGAGTYTFYAKDANGCISEVSNTVEILPVPELTLSVDSTQAVVECNGEYSAEIRITANGGLGNYVYELYKSNVLHTVTPTSLLGDTAIFGGLASGTYYVRVISGDCSSRTANITISEAPAMIAAVATSTNETCFGRNDGTINIDVTGGTGTITYHISPRFDRVVTAEYIRSQSYEPGTYVVLARDGNGCEMEFNFVIQPATQLVATLTAYTSETCFGYANGSVSITVSGGKLPYETRYVTGSYSTTFAANKFFYDNLPASASAGTIIVKDANGCETYVTVPALPEGADLQAKAVSISECAGNNTMTNRIEVSVNPLYASQVTYALDGGTPQVTPVFANVSTGTHTITISHPDGCVTNTTVFVTDYQSLSVVTSTSTEITCNGANDASITFVVQGGSSSYTYTISPNAGNFDEANGRYTNLPQGSYIVQVVDNQLGCSISQSFDFAEPSVLTVTASTVSETCYQANDGKAIFTIRGGRTPYSYELKDSQGNVVTSTTIANSSQVTVTGLKPDTYVLTYVDKGSVCTKTETLLVSAVPNLKPTNDIEVKYECATSSTTFTTAYIEVNFDDAGGIFNRNNTFYALNSNQLADAKLFTEFSGNKAIIRDLPDGQNQYITIFYGSCAYTIPSSEYFDVETHKALILRDISDPKTMNVIKVKATGGKEPYTYYFNGNQSDGIDEYHLTPNDPGYTTPDGRVIKQIQVRVTDDLNPGCEQVITIEKELIDILIPNKFTPNGDGNDDTWGPGNSRLYPNMTIRIYDRYGRLIKRLGQGERWDGMYNGSYLPTGDYWYIMKLNTDDEHDREFIGHFTLFR